MSSEEVIEIINTLCEKIGLATNDISQLVPAYASYKTFDLITWVAGFFIAIIALIIPTIIYFKKLKRLNVTLFNFKGIEDQTTIDELVMKSSFCCAGLFLICLFAALIFYWIFVAAEWQLFPEAKMIDTILNMIT